MRGDRAAESTGFSASTDRRRGSVEPGAHRPLPRASGASGREDRANGDLREGLEPASDSLLTAADHAALRRESLLGLARRIHRGLRQRRAGLVAARARLEARAAELEQREREVRWAESVRDRKDAEETRRLEGRIAEVAAWESSLRLESERLDALWRRRNETLDSREEGLAERESQLVQRERQLQQREALLRQQQKQLDEFSASSRLDAEREALDLAAGQERMAREQAVLERNRREVQQRSQELDRIVSELDHLLGAKIDWDEARQVEEIALPHDLPYEREARTRQALAIQSEKIAQLVEQVESQVIGALEDRVVAERLHRHLCTVCDPQRVALEEISLRERLSETLRGVVALLREHRSRAMRWHSSLDEQSQQIERRRRQRWEQLTARWQALGLTRGESAGPTTAPHASDSNKARHRDAA